MIKMSDKWNPKIGEIYYVPSFGREQLDSISFVWENNHWDQYNRLMGLVFRTQEEAAEAKRKMLSAIKRGD